MSPYGNPALRAIYTFNSRWYYPLVMPSPYDYTEFNHNLHNLRDVRGPQIGLAVSPVYPPYSQFS